MRIMGSKLLPITVTVILVMSFLGLGAGHLWGEVPPAKNYNVTAAQGKIKIDGVLDEPDWENAVKIDIPYEWFPGNNIEPPVKTECMVTYTKSKLYVAFRCFDPEPKKIRAHLMDRDATATLVQDDHVIILLDTFNDERRAFQFRVNPLGVQADANYSELDGIEDFSWDAIWNSAGKITDFGYVVEVAIPFNQLRFFKSAEKQTWGITLERRYPRTSRHLIRSHPTDRNRQCFLCQMNKITGFEGISPGNNIEFDPTLTVNRTDTLTKFPNGEMDAGKIKVEPGITARWGITPNLMLNAAVNPDFSHVEADAAQLEVNTRFALRYPEKRPFFLEGADFFTTPLEAVFSRSVYDPVWGAKLTGKVGKNALGLFVTQDKDNTLLFPSNQGSYIFSEEEDVYSTVLRYRRDVGKGSTVGLLYTGRYADGYFNHVAGADGFLRLSRTKNVTFQYLHSQTQYPEDLARRYGQSEDNFGGDAFLLNFRHNSRSFRYRLTYQNLSEDFRADYGFIPRVDIRDYQVLFEPIKWGKRGGWFNRLSLIFFYWRITDGHNDLTDQDFRFSVQYDGPLNTTFLPTFMIQKEWYNGITYDKNLLQTVFAIAPAKGLTLTLISQVGETIDYTNSRLANLFLLEGAVNLSLGSHLNINLDHTYQKLSLSGDKIFDVNLFQGTLIYNFNVRTFVRAICQYQDVARNTDLFIIPVQPESRTFFTQFLFAYKINPHTKLFIGYSDNYQGLKGIDLTQTNRTFFLKIGYALVY